MYNYKLLDEEACEFIPVVDVAELQDGERIFLEIDELEIVLFAIAGEYFAIEDICSHDDGPLGSGDIEGFEIVCPRHGAHFDIRTGKALSLPAIVDIASYPVRIADDQIEVGIPID